MKHLYRILILSLTILLGSGIPAEARKVLLEGYMGLWCGWCPRGTVAIQDLKKLYPDLICIKYHGYSTNTSVLGFNITTSDIMPLDIVAVPAATVNRTLPEDNFSYANGRHSLEAVIDSVRESPVISDLKIASVDFDYHSKTLTANTNTSFSQSHDFRLAYFLVADGITVRQTNFLSGRDLSDDSLKDFPGLEEYVNKGQNVTETVDDCLLLASDTKGIEGSLSNETNVEQEHSYGFNLSSILDHAVFEEITGMRVVVALIADNVVYDADSYEINLSDLQTPPLPSIESIEISEWSSEMYVGDKFTPVYSVYPIGWEEYDELVWESTDETVATVDEAGNVTAVGEGTCTIIAHSRIKESIKESRDVTVTIRPETYDFSLNERVAYRDTRINIPVYLNNNLPILGFQLDINLPEGMTLISADDNSLVETTSRISHMQISTARRDDGTVRVICFSNNNDLIYPGTEAILQIPVMIGSEAASSLTMSLSNITISNEQSKPRDCEPVTVSYEVRDLLKGDLDGDGKKSVADVTSTVALVLNQTIMDITPEAADMNNDGEVDILDIVMLVNAILTEPARSNSCYGAPKRIENETEEIALPSIISIRDYEFNFGDNIEFEVRINEAANYIGAQFDIELPAGISLKNMDDVSSNFILNENSAPHHILAASPQEDGRYRILIYSLSNAQFKEGEEVLLKLTAETADNSSIEATGSVSGVKLVNSDFNTFQGADSDYSVIYHGNTSVDSIKGNGIQATTTPESIVLKNLTYGEILTIYTADGRMIYTGKATSDEISISLNSGLYMISHNGEVVTILK